jgi:hypothetical protein
LPMNTKNSPMGCELLAHNRVIKAETRPSRLRH